MAQGLLCFLSLIKTLMYIYIYIFFSNIIFSRMYFSRKKNRIDGKKERWRERGERERNSVNCSVFVCDEGQKKGKRGGAEADRKRTQSY